MRLRLTSLAVLTVAALAAAGCGGGGNADTTSARAVTATGGSVQPIVDAAARTAAKRSAHVTLRGITEAAGQRIPISAAGAFDLKAGKGRFTATTRVAGQAVRLEEISDGLDLYLHSDALAGRLPGGKRWVKLDLAKVGRSSGVDLSALQSLGNGDPTQILGYLKRVGDVRKIGRATIGGTATTHYAGAVQLAKVAPPGDAAAARALRRLKQLTGLDRVPVEAWISDDGLVRRERVAVDARAAKTGGGARLDLTVDFTRFGVRVDAPVPPGGDVFDASNLAGALGGG
jgi:hypothetical protein